MTKKVKFWQIKNVLVSLKAIATSLVNMLILIIPLGLAYYFRSHQSLAVAIVVQILTFVASLWVWGYLARKFWKWK